MNKIYIVLVIFSFMQISLFAKANDTIYIKESQTPILIERYDNPLLYFKLNTKDGGVMDHITFSFGENVNLKEIASLKLYYGGTEAVQIRDANRFAPQEYMTSMTPGKTLSANKSYSLLLGEVKKLDRTITLKLNKKLYPGMNYFWVSLRMKKTASIDSKINISIDNINIDKENAPLKNVTVNPTEFRLGVGVRHAGDDGSAAFRIPGLVTTNRGTLLGVYDVRYNSSVDLQERVDIGLSRSTDGGQTWEKMRIPMSFGEYGGMPSAQNGVGDPSILVDEKTNTIWIIAVWCHGMGNQRSWWSSHQGMDKYITGQLMLVKSEDDGKTWSKPVNITEKVKKSEWFFLLQGPGRGITMSDGTLVFPIQFIDETRVPNAGIMYSKDRGENWHITNMARTNTTEAQVTEIEPGVLMLNMRDNRGGSRAVSITNDLGNSWIEHSSSRHALREPVCMASLINVKAEDNILGKDLLIFSNPDTTKGRHHITIKVSLDKGVTWLPEHQIMLDENEGWGYSSLTMVDKETVGILYESSVAHITYQRVKLKDLVKD